MFVQVIQGQTSNPHGLRRQFDHWLENLSPGARGFLGSTAGVTPTGEFIAFVRFESETAARANSDRPEQDAWWKETAGYLTGPARFLESQDVDVFRGGVPDHAGFVQILRGRARDPQRLRALEAEAVTRLAELRPEILGSLRAWHDHGSFTEVVAFTSEAAARSGEARSLPSEAAARLEEWRSGIEGLRFLDLPEPWLASRLDLKTIARRFYDEVVNLGNLALIEDFVAADFVEHESFPGLPPGRDAVRGFVVALREGFPDVTMTVERIVAEDDEVWAHVTLRGTHAGKFLDLAPTGRSVEVQVIDRIRFTGGKAVEHWGVTDQMTMLQQLGAIGG